MRDGTQSQSNEISEHLRGEALPYSVGISSFMKNHQHNPGGRPTKLTESLIQKICKLLHTGAYIETAAVACGIHKSTLYEWLKKSAAINRDDNELTPEESLLVMFSDAVERAMAESEITALRQIDAAARSGIWQAAAWRLERKFPNQWGRKIRAEISDPDDKPNEPVYDLGKLSDEQLRVFEELLKIITSDSAPVPTTGSV